MNKTFMTDILNQAQSFVTKHSPELLMAVGIGGMISAAVMTAKATPKAIQLIEKTKKEEHKDKLTKMETIKAAWKPYIPAIITEVVSIGCIIGANSIHAKRNAMLVTAYKLSETALHELSTAVTETVDEDKVKEIREKVAEKRIESDPVSVKEVIYTGKGRDLFYDYYSGRYFESSANVIDAAANKINGNILLGDMYASLNEFYSEIGLPTIGLGDDIGWNTDNRIEVDHDNAIVTDDGRAAVVLAFLRPPKHEYDRLCY